MLAAFFSENGRRPYVVIQDYQILSTFLVQPISLLPVLMWRIFGVLLQKFGFLASIGFSNLTVLILRYFLGHLLLSPLFLLARSLTLVERLNVVVHLCGTLTEGLFHPQVWGWNVLDTFDARGALRIAGRLDMHNLFTSIVRCSSSIHESLIKLTHWVLLKSLPLLQLQHFDDLILLLGVNRPWRKYARAGWRGARCSVLLGGFYIHHIFFEKRSSNWLNHGSTGFELRLTADHFGELHLLPVELSVLTPLVVPKSLLKRSFLQVDSTWILAHRSNFKHIYCNLILVYYNLFFWLYIQFGMLIL